MNESSPSLSSVADRLASLYERPFGGKEKGRYRIAIKLMRQLAGRRRLYQEDVQDIARALLERGYVLIDMDSFFVVMSANSFVNYRRTNEVSISA